MALSGEVHLQNIIPKIKGVYHDKKKNPKSLSAVFVDINSG